MRFLALLSSLPICALAQSAATVSQQGLPSATPEQVGLSTSALRRVDAQLHAWVDSGKVAGIVGVVIRHGMMAYVTSAGSLDSAGAPIAGDAVFRMYSMTKPIASTAVMQLVEAGKVRLSDPVSKYIPAFANTKVFVGGSMAQPQLAALARPITIADLLTHTSGLTYGVFGNSAVDSLYVRANMLGSQYTLAQFADSIAMLPLLFQPGTRFNYGLSIDVLGRVVEVASGMTFDAYLDSAIFRPLGMTSTAFHPTRSMRARMTRVYAPTRAGKLMALGANADAMYADSSRMLSGGAGLLSTIPDYARFAQMLMSGGELDGHRILKRETVHLMMQNHLPLALTPIMAKEPEPPGRNGFGYGGAVRLDSASAQMPGSAGTFRWSGYASTFFWIDRQNDLIGMLFTQFIPEPAVWSIDGEFQKLVYGALRPGSGALTEQGQLAMQEFSFNAAQALGAGHEQLDKYTTSSSYRRRNYDPAHPLVGSFIGKDCKDKPLRLVFVAFKPASPDVPLAAAVFRVVGDSLQLEAEGPGMNKDVPGLVARFRNPKKSGECVE
ncbi:MAG TPA: serine hydrolase domain-containing protein [Gemmatimonadaceae bacterium]|nr:serine hydrolase domain-containing protein [Gemmatimonadaceae bacterium]